MKFILNMDHAHVKGTNQLSVGGVSSSWLVSSVSGSVFKPCVLGKKKIFPYSSSISIFPSFHFTSGSRNHQLLL